MFGSGRFAGASFAGCGAGHRRHRAGGRRHVPGCRGCRSCPPCPLLEQRAELLLQVPLRRRFLQVGAPDLVDHEQQHQNADRDEDASDGAENTGEDDAGRVRARPLRIRRPSGPALSGWFGAPVPFGRVLMEPVVHFRGAVSLLGRFPALAGVDLDVAAGEIVLLQGPNGAGKTTLLRVCAGLVPVTEWHGRVLGHDLTRRPPAVRRQVGLLGHATRPVRRPDRRRQRAVLGPRRRCGSGRRPTRR